MRDVSTDFSRSFGIVTVKYSYTWNINLRVCTESVALVLTNPNCHVPPATRVFRKRGYPANNVRLQPNVDFFKVCVNFLKKSRAPGGHDIHSCAQAII